MNRTGPDLEVLTHRLAATPAEFLAEPYVATATAAAGTLHVAALVNDVLALIGARADGAALARLRGDDRKPDRRKERNRLTLAAIAAWLLADDWFAGAGIDRDALLAVFDEAVTELAAAAPAQRFVDDPDRREELARVVLARLDFRPAGETVAQATDRLSSISGVERQRLLKASRAAEERARAIREALARKAAEESADKWTRE